MPGAAPNSKKENHLVAGRRKLEAYRKKKAEEKKAEETRVGDRNNSTESVGDGNNSAEKPIANDVHAEGIFANGTDSSPSIEGNGKETYEVLHSNVGVNGDGAWSVGGLNKAKSNGLPQNLWLERGSSSESHKTKSSAKGSAQGLPPFSENIPASTTTAVTLLEGDLAVKIPENLDSESSTSKTAFQNFAGPAGSVYEQVPWMGGTPQVENRSSLKTLEKDLAGPAPFNHDSVSSKHQESARVVSDGSLPSRIVDNSLQRPSGASFGLRTASLHDFSLAFPVSNQQTDIPALSLASSIKDKRAGNDREELASHFRSSVTSNGMKPRDSKEAQFLFAETQKLPSSEREALFSSRLRDKASFQPSSGLVPVNPTASAVIPSISDYKGGSSVSVSASDGSLAHAFPEQEKDLKPVNQNEGRQKRAENDDFIALEQHIDELTQEKFALQRALDAARSLAESLSQQNSVLTEDFNSQGAIINQLQEDLEKKKEEVTSQSLVLSSLMMERERAQQENNSAVERSQILAGEVIGLEEKVLKLRSSELKLQRELETLKSDNDSFRVHLGTLEKDRQNMRSMLEALQEDKKLLQIQLQKTFGSNDGMRTSTPKEVPQVDSKDASTSTDDLGVQTQNTQTAGSVVQRHVSHPELKKSLDYTGEASSSSILVSSPRSMSIGVPSAFATLSADDFRAINSIDGLITELLSEKGALLESFERESAKASELQALNMELSKKLETQTQRLELVVAQNMAHGANAIATNSIEIEPQYNDYVDEGDEVVERVLGWIMRLFPGGSSRRQSSKLL